MYTSYYWALGALGLYTALRTYCLLRGRGLLQIASAALAALSYAVYPILVVMGITRPWGDGMHIAIVVSGFFFSAAFLETLLLFLRDLWLALRWAAGKIRRRISGDSFCLSFAPERKRSAALPVFFAFLAFTGAAYGTWQTQRLPLIREVEIPIPRLPSSMDGLRIVQLSDVHLSPLFAHRRIVRIVEAAQTLKPDLIVVTGDIADGTPQARLADVRVLAGLQKSAPLVMVPGNHDYYVDFAAWRECYRSLGLPLLENSSVRLTLRGGAVTVAGLTDRSGAAFRGLTFRRPCPLPLPTRSASRSFTARRIPPPRPIRAGRWTSSSRATRTAPRCSFSGRWSPFRTTATSTACTGSGACPFT